MMVIRTSGKACCILLVLFHTSYPLAIFGIGKSSGTPASKSRTSMRATEEMACRTKHVVGNIIEDDLKHDHMPDYRYGFEEDMVVVHRKEDGGQSALLLPVPGENVQLSPGVHEKARESMRRATIPTR